MGTRRNHTHRSQNTSRAPRATKGLKLSPVRKIDKIGRNEICPCGSGRKFKHCCIKK